MRQRSKLPRPLVTAALWPFGIGLTSWHYMWRTTPLHRREQAGSPSRDAIPDLPTHVRSDDVQLPGDGVGALFHRRYRARIRDARLSPNELMGALMASPDRVAPSEFARFTKVAGDEGRMAVGDEYVVRMPGPWNGPVRVVDTTPSSFRLVTLRGHLEAGQIEFRVEREIDELVFTIESWAASGDRLSKLLYQHVRMAKEVQLHMWTSFLENAARLARGRLAGGIDIDTRRVERDDLRDKAINFDLDRRAEFTAEHGWHVDSYRQVLPAEAPGPPEPGGPWAVASRLVRDYEFADPRIVRAVYDADRPLDQREMLLEARFWGLRFRLGVRVGGVVDGERTVDGRPVRVFGWNYRTLQGHLEMGQIDFEVWKWLDTGEVEFRIAAFSRRAPVANPLVRLGLRLFGRREQLRFARHACERMARLTAAALATPSSATTTPPASSSATRRTPCCSTRASSSPS